MTASAVLSGLQSNASQGIEPQKKEQQDEPMAAEKEDRAKGASPLNRTIEPSGTDATAISFSVSHVTDATASFCLGEEPKDTSLSPSDALAAAGAAPVSTVDDSADEPESESDASDSDSTVSGSDDDTNSTGPAEADRSHASVSSAAVPSSSAHLPDASFLSSLSGLGDVSSLARELADLRGRVHALEAENGALRMERGALVEQVSQTQIQALQMVAHCKRDYETIQEGLRKRCAQLETENAETSEALREAQETAATALEKLRRHADRQATVSTSLSADYESRVQALRIELDLCRTDLVRHKGALDTTTGFVAGPVAQGLLTAQRRMDALGQAAGHALAAMGARLASLQRRLAHVRALRECDTVLVSTLVRAQTEERAAWGEVLTNQGKRIKAEVQEEKRLLLLQDKPRHPAVRGAGAGESSDSSSNSDDSSDGVASAQARRRRRSAATAASEAVGYSDASLRALREAHESEEAIDAQVLSAVCATTDYALACTCGLQSEEALLDAAASPGPALLDDAEDSLDPVADATRRNLSGALALAEEGALRSEAMRLDAEAATLRAALRRCTRLLAHNTDMALQRTKAQLEGATRLLEAAHEERDVLVVRCRRAEAELAAEKRAAAQALQRSEAARTRQVETARDACARAKAQASQYASQLEALQADHANTVKEVRRLDSELLRVSQSSATAHSKSVDDAVQRVGALQAQVTALRAEREQATAALEATQTALAQAQTQIKALEQHAQAAQAAAQAAVGVAPPHMYWDPRLPVHPAALQQMQMMAQQQQQQHQQEQHQYQQQQHQQHILQQQHLQALQVRGVAIAPTGVAPAQAPPAAVQRPVTQ
jgi:hypothetical protein